MKKDLRHLFSVLLVFAMILPMVGVARASGTPAAASSLPAREIYAAGENNDVYATTASASPISVSALSGSLYNSIRSKFYAVTSGTYPDDSDTVILSSPTTSTGSLTVARGGNPRLDDFKEAYVASSKGIQFTPAATNGSATTFTVNYSLTHGGTTINGVITITISLPQANASVTLANTLTPYTFSSADASGASTGLAQLQSAASYTSTYYIRFALAPKSNTVAAVPGVNVGTLYFNGSVVGNNTQISVPYTSLGSLYFQPSGYVGVYAIDYVVWDPVLGGAVKTGTLSINVTNGTLNVSFTLNSGNSYSFINRTDTTSGLGTGSSAYSLITSAISTYGGLTAADYYIRFAAPSTTVGTLYFNNSVNGAVVSSADYINYATLQNLCFKPMQAGTYQTSYSVYSLSNKTTALASGTLTIYVSTVFGAENFSYRTTFGGSVTFNEADFLAYVQKTLGVNYSLSYVTFNDYSGNGTFKNGVNAFVPRSNGTYFYSRSYTGAPVNANYLSNVSFTAPTSVAGYTAVSFTAYGSLYGGAMTSSTPGVFYIYYTAANVPAIVYNAYGTNSVSLKESDFQGVYRTAMGTAATANPSFTIRFETIPGYGRLYQTSGTGANSKTQLTVLNIGGYNYTVGANNTSRSINIVTYEPTSRLELTDEIEYTVYNNANAALYKGTIQFKLAAPKSVTVSSDGVSFSASDFHAVTSSDPVLYILFKAPSAGKLYVQQGTQLIPVSESDKFYTTDASSGKYAVSSLHYIPRVASTSPVTLSYTVYTKSGGTYTDTMTVTPTSKNSSTKASASFNDVSGTVGSWAADSVDFANKYGLVKGVGNGKFSPDATMKRCDLVLILYRMAGSPAVSGTTPYTDLPSPTTNSYTQEICTSALWAYQKGLMTNGVVNDNKYNPDGAITRQDYATILYNYTKNVVGTSVTNSGSLANYVDKDKASAYAVDALTWAVANGYINSMETGRLVLSPDTSATRAQIVTLLHRYLTF